MLGGLQLGPSHHVHDNEDKLHDAEDEVGEGVDFPHQDRPAGEFEQEMATSLHPADVWQ